MGLEGLTNAAVDIFGFGNTSDKDPSKRNRKPIHTIETPERRQQVGELAQRAYEAMRTAHEDPDNSSGWRHEETSSAGLEVIGDDWSSTVVMHRIAISEIDPDWLQTATPEQIEQESRVLKSCRDLSRMCLLVNVQALNTELPSTAGLY